MKFDKKLYGGDFNIMPIKTKLKFEDFLNLKITICFLLEAMLLLCI